MIAQPVWAAETEVTSVSVVPTPKGFGLVINTQGNNRPPIFTVNRGNNSIVDINNAQLRMPNGESFQQEKPAPGINAVEVRQLDSSTIRVVVEGVNAAPIVEVIRRDDQPGVLALTFDRAPSANEAAANPDLTSANQPSSTGARPTAVPPSLSRAKAPPVGDLAIAPLDVTPDRIELGSDQIIPKLLLREAPVREVLTLLGRAANVNVAFADTSSGTEGAASGPTISLDIENESVEEVFNYVLRLSGLQANRVGQTIFVGQTLPGDAQNRVVRTLRLNQIKATSETKTLDTILTEADTGGNITPQGSGTQSNVIAETAITRKTDIQETIQSLGAKEILETYGANNGSTERIANSNLLETLSVIADARTNSVTLIGTPRKVELATSLLLQLDVRKRQVAVNVKFIDIDLLKGKNANADLQFRINDTLGIGFRPDPGDASGATSGLSILGASNSALAFPNPLFSLTNTFLGTLFVSIQDTSAKILTNPTLLIQEGSSAQVNLTEQVFSGFESSIEQVATPGGGTTSVSRLQPIIQNAGVIFNVTVNHIDDNGFVTLSLSPEVSSLSGDTFEDSIGGEANLLTQRRLETGKIRLRDGQTLVLTGIIQDQDRVSVSKVPILGDIPLLGRLFRRETNSRQRTELVVLVTPQILDDSDQSTAGYPYTPGKEAQELLDR
jgi:type IV pilus assembly protein PilQ